MVMNITLTFKNEACQHASGNVYERNYNNIKRFEEHDDSITFIVEFEGKNKGELIRQSYKYYKQQLLGFATTTTRSID